MFLFKKKSDWKCMKCNKLNHYDAAFCEFCGAPRETSARSRQTEKLSDCVEEANVSVAEQQANSLIECPMCGSMCECGEVFCNNCGAAIQKTNPDSAQMQEIVPLAKSLPEQIFCNHCGTMNPDQNRFCAHCGEEIREGRYQRKL